MQQRGPRGLEVTHAEGILQPAEQEPRRSAASRGGPAHRLSSFSQRRARSVDLSRVVEEVSGVPLPFNKALVGENAFSHKLDIHVQRVLAHGPLFEPLVPEMVGNRRVIPLGRHTGPFIVGLKLGEHGLNAEPDQIAEMVVRIEKLALKMRTALTDQQFLDIAKEVIAG